MLYPEFLASGILRNGEENPEIDGSTKRKIKITVMVGYFCTIHLSEKLIKNTHEKIAIRQRNAIHIIYIHI